MIDAVAANLEGEAVKWKSGLRDAQAPELWNFDLFTHGLSANLRMNPKWYRRRKTSTM
ncbi:hypothetical protein NXF25_008551 [Crotalus adamanteus]|uniref:Uncharacterized protein n=1 Tax=Crotalus adamanteus TaxID=8729 RepID=A0AAW1BND0_CROAD